MSRLEIYNGAIVDHIGEEPLDTLTDDRPVRYALDSVWTRNGVRRCLRMGQWNFAARTQRLDYDPAITPEFGEMYAFAKPTDLVRIMGLCSDERFEFPLTHYKDENGYWWSDLDQIYIRYVSDDTTYGLDYSLWPDDFTEFVECHFAYKVTSVAAYAGLKDDLREERKELLKVAKQLDAMGQEAKKHPPGTWSTSRHRGGSGGYDIGSRSRLIG